MSVLSVYECKRRKSVKLMNKKYDYFIDIYVINDFYNLVFCFIIDASFPSCWA